MFWIQYIFKNIHILFLKNFKNIFCSLSFLQFLQVYKAESSLLTPPVDNSLEFSQNDTLSNKEISDKKRILSSEIKRNI